MKILSRLIIAILATAAVGQPVIAQTKVFILAGQSNMDGRGDGSKLTTDDKSRLAKAQSHIELAYNRQPIRPLDTTVPRASLAKKFKLEEVFGPELFFGLGLADAWPDQKILFIKRSVGGTSLYGCWNPDWSLEKATVMQEEKKTRLYSDLVEYIGEVLDEEDNYEICGMLWVQGEADSGVKKYGSVPADTYGDNLKKLIGSIRKETEVEDLPFLMLQVGNGNVVAGMQHAAETMKNVSFIPQSRDVDAPNYLPGYGPPVGHYNYEGMKRIGTQFAEVYLREYATQTN